MVGACGRVCSVAVCGDCGVIFVGCAQVLVPAVPVGPGVPRWPSRGSPAAPARGAGRVVGAPGAPLCVVCCKLGACVAWSSVAGREMVRMQKVV